MNDQIIDLPAGTTEAIKRAADGAVEISPVYLELAEELLDRSVEEPGPATEADLPVGSRAPPTVGLPANDAPSGRPIPSDPDALLTTAEAAALVGLTVRALEARRLIGELPVFCSLSRRCVRYRRDDLEYWIRSSRRASTSATEPPADVEIPNQGV